jgi:hypothetical protein
VKDVGKNKNKKMKPRLRFLKQLRSLLMIPANGWESTETQENGKLLEEASPPAIQTSNDGPHQILEWETLIYWDFIQIMLGRKPQPENWDDIIAAHSEAIKTPKSTSVFECWKKIEFLTTKLNFVTLACNYLKHEHDDGIAEQLMLHGYDYVQPNDNRDEYLKQIYLVETEAKTLVVLLNQYYIEFKALSPEGENPSDITLEKYEKELGIVGKYLGFRINKFEVTCPEYCAFANLYIESNNNG